MPGIARFLWLAMLVPAALAAPPPAGTSLTVDELDRLLSDLHDTSDVKVALQLAGLKLSERLSAERLARWKNEIQGNRSRAALVALADLSAFLNPPAAEIPSAAPPDDATQKQILARTLDYVKDAIPKLPNFYALRTTTAYEIATADQLRRQHDKRQLFETRQNTKFPYQALGPATWCGLPNGQLFWVGSMSQVVRYQGGFEEGEPATEKTGQAGKALLNMTTTGEFGPVLSTIFDQVPADEIVWDHWEQGPMGTLAVFRYAVPRERSRFAVIFGADQVPDFPAFHGEIAVDPVKGTVFHITMEAIEHDPVSTHEVFTLVEYGSMQIGAMDYVVPVHGVAVAKDYDPYSDLNAEPSLIPYGISVNDTSFTDYHVFRAKSRVVNGVAGP